MADDGYVTVFRTNYLAEGELVTELLEGEGMDARFRGVNAALIGAGPQIFETRVDVPAESEVRVGELYADLMYVAAAAEADGELEAEPRPPGPAPRRSLLAGVALLVPGGGHFYARRPWTGLVILSAIIYSYVGALGAADRGEGVKGEIGFGMFIALFLCDAIGGVRACRRENRGIHPEMSDQLFTGLLLVFVSAAAGAAFMAAAIIPRLLLEHRLEQFAVRATSTELIVKNGDRDGRGVQIRRLSIEVGGGQSLGRLFDVDGDRALSWLAAGEQATVRFDVPDEAGPYCDLARLPDGPDTIPPCNIVFLLEASRPDGSSRLEAIGSCPLTSATDADGVPCKIIARAQTSRAGVGR
jgi:hypothetical protein